MIYPFRIIALSLALVCSSLQGWADERFPFLGEISSDKVSIRAGYHTNFERLDILAKGTKLLVQAKNYGWYKVQLPPSANAYVRVDYVKVVNNKVGQITADRLNIRAGKGVNFSPIGQLTKGTYVRLVSKFDDWFQIEPVEGLYGWVNADYLKMKSSTVPSLAELGLSPVSLETSEQDASVAAETGAVSSLGMITANGVIRPASTDVALKNIQYQFVADDQAVYYLKVDPAVVKNFTHKAVRLEGEAVSDVSSSLPHALLSVKKFNLVL